LISAGHGHRLVAGRGRLRGLRQHLLDPVDVQAAGVAVLEALQNLPGLGDLSGLKVEG
jgi:hypothetical protein